MRFYHVKTLIFGDIMVTEKSARMMLDYLHEIGYLGLADIKALQNIAYIGNDSKVTVTEMQRAIETKLKAEENANKAIQKGDYDAFVSAYNELEDAKNKVDWLMERFLKQR